MHQLTPAADFFSSLGPETFERFFTLTLDLMCVANVDGYFKVVSPAFEVLGYTREEILSIPFFDLLHPDDLETSSAAVAELAHGKSLVRIDNRFRCKDGSYRWISWSCAPDPTGALYAIGRDITDEKRGEQELLLTQQRLALATRSAAIGIWDWDVVADRLTWDDGMYDIYGVSRDVFGSAYETWRSGLHPEDAEHADAEVKQALNGQKKFDTEFRIIHPSGEIRRVRAHAVVERDASGVPLRMVGVNIDITQQKAGERAQAHLAAIVKDSGDAIIGRDLQGIITSWNKGAEQMFGHLAQEVIGGPMPLSFVGDEKGDAIYMKERLMVGDGVHHLETVRFHKDGTELDVSVTLSPIRDPAGRVNGVSTIARDITELKNTQKELLREKERTDLANKELEAFSYSVAHDLRAPLRSIDGFSQALFEDWGDKLDDQGRRYLRFVRESAQLMGHLIDDILTLSRVTRSELKVQKIDMSQVARATHARLCLNYPEREVEVTIQDGLVGVGDARLLGVMMDNLLGNAWKFTGKKSAPVIEFGADMSGPTPVYFVRDNGAGFDMNYAEKLFGVFQRLHSANEFEGTGVGLATVQRIVHRHGGRVWAEGHVDIGATFYFTLAETA